MKNRLKKITKFLFAMLLLASCSEDLYDEQINQRNFKTEVVPIRKLEKDFNFKQNFQKTTGKSFQSKLEKNNTAIMRGEFSTDYVIVDTLAHVASGEGLISYNFKIEYPSKPTTDTIHNLVIHENNNTQISDYFITKNVVSAEKLTPVTITTSDETSRGIMDCFEWIEDPRFFRHITLYIDWECIEASGGSGSGGTNTGGVGGNNGGIGENGSGSGGDGSGTSWNGGGSSTGGVLVSPIGGGGSTSNSFYNSLLLPQQQWFDDQSSETQQSINDYLSANNLSAQSKNIIKRWIDLQIALDSNPNLLLDIPCDQIPAWQNLTQFTPPASVITKIEQLDAQDMFTDFEIQYLQDASGTVVNCDYFPVVINNFPTNPSTGLPFTPTQFLNHIRRFINSFINTSYSSFSPSTITGINESAIWNSSNGLGAILHIDIPPPGGDGSVICSHHSNSSWIFTTIEVPYGPNQGQDGIHPVSGNREFGIFQNPDGSYTFYTRAVDRMTDSFESTIAENSTIFMSAFENPDLLWNSLINKVSNYVQNNGGNAITPISTDNKIWRPNWYKVRQYLRGEVSLSELGCH